MEFLNLSDRPLKFAGSKEGLLKMIVLPDYSPGRDSLPVGVAAVYDRRSHVITSDYLGPDVGCGMALARFKSQPLGDLDYAAYKVASELKSTEQELGSLGGGNHFIDFFRVKKIAENPLGIEPEDDLVLVHSGSRLRGQEVYERDLKGDDYLREYEMLIRFGKRNREALLNTISRCTDNGLVRILDLPHNTLEISRDKVTYRKGAIEMLPGDYAVISSSMGGEALVVQGTNELRETEFSMCHGTGRKISRSEARKARFSSEQLRKRICIPSIITDDNIATELPECYRTIEETMPKIEKYVRVIGVLEPKACIVS